MKHLKTILGAFALLAAVSCTKSQQEGCGRISFEVASDNNVTDITKSNVSDYTTLPSAAQFTINILDASKTSVWSGKISEWDSATMLTAGSYSVEARYGALEEEGFDKPYFYGSQSFTVTGGETTAVSIPVTLGNTVILVSCTESFKNYYKDYSFTLSRNGTDIVTFVKDEPRGAFVDGYKFTITGTIIGEIKTQTFTKDYTYMKEATAYTLLFDASNVGGGTITISFNDTVETVELGDIELND